MLQNKCDNVGMGKGAIGLASSLGGQHAKMVVEEEAITVTG